MWVNSALSQIGLSQVGPGQLGPTILVWSYNAYYFREGCRYEVCFILKQKFEGIMFGSIYIVGLLNKRENNQRCLSSYIHIPIYDPRFHVRPYCFDQLPYFLIQWSENDNWLVCKIWEVSA